MCDIPNMELFQNGGDACDESYGHGICGRTGARNVGRVEEAAGQLRFATEGAAEARRSPNRGGGNYA